MQKQLRRDVNQGNFLALSKKYSRIGRIGVACSIAVAGMGSLIFVGAAQAGVPGYNIYAFTPVGTDTVGSGRWISNSGNFAAGYTQNPSGTNAVLLNTSNGATTVESQNGVIYQGTTPETSGAPFSVNNQGVMFGSSGAGSTVETGAVTVWDNGQGYNLPYPRGYSSGQIYGSTDYLPSLGQTLAVGGVGSEINNAAVFHYYGPGSPSNYAGALSTNSGYETVNGGTLQVPYGINDSEYIIGTANDPNNAALTVPFILNYGSGAKVAQIIPNSSGQYNSGIPFAISNSGLVTGSEAVNSGGGGAFIYNVSTGVTTAIPEPPGAGSAEGRGINDQGEVVGYAGSLYAVPFLYDGTNTYNLDQLLANNQNGAWHLSDNTSSAAFSIADNGDIVGVAMHNGVLSGFLMVPTGSTLANSQSLTFNNAGGSGDGVTWDTNQLNFNNGSGVTTFSSANADNVSFTDTNNGHYIVNIPTTVTPGTTTFNNSQGNYVVNGPGSIGGMGRGDGTLTKLGTGTLTLNNVNTYYGPTSIQGGTVILNVNGALPAGTALSIYGTGTSVVVASQGTPYAVTFKSLNIGGGADLELNNNDLILHGGDTVSGVTGYLRNGLNNGAWNGTGGITSTFAGHAHPLLALGAIANDNGSGTPLYGAGGTISSTFGGATPVDGDVLVKLTYYGDTNLDGKVDGTDYSKIDNAYLADTAYLATNPKIVQLPYTGWANGDFNYDGSIDGSDYTLIDNAYNSQGATITSEVATTTAQLAGTSAVPEPMCLSLLGGMAMTSLSRRRRTSRGKQGAI